MKKVLITGGTGNIGFEIVKKFLELGYYVIIHGRKNLTRDQINVLSQYQNQYDTFLLDAANINDLTSLDNKIKESDVLINVCGGGGEHQSWDVTSIEKWSEVYQANVILPVFFIKQIIPYMRNQHYGRIINISSVSSVKTLEIGPEYSSAKAGLAKLTESLARECKDTGITANTISPGLVLTEPVKKFIRNAYALEEMCDNNIIQQTISEKFFPNLTGTIPLPREIAEMVYFLASDNGNSITGQNIVIDSGYLLSDYVKAAVK